MNIIFRARIGAGRHRISNVIFGATVKHDLESITKSVTSLLVGIGVDRGWIADIDTPVFTYFPEYNDVRTPEKEQIRLTHLLTMSAGLVWNESLPWNDPANNERQMDEAGDPYRTPWHSPSPGRRVRSTTTVVPRRRSFKAAKDIG
jgi:CubicO group peptidase (beta-lactamase class C family)